MKVVGVVVGVLVVRVLYLSGWLWLHKAGLNLILYYIQEANAAD